MILFKLLNRSFLTEIYGCVSTGKEANVYHAIAKNQILETQNNVAITPLPTSPSSSNEIEVAIKVYKTSILIFKDRDKYVTGEFRFRFLLLFRLVIGI